ncbi:mobile element transfer protein [Streptomyces capitiformicae]|uniref:Uncharacterized protein n=1 Tax=Streptomyces capitiformicae TaxID=2014920 RepID=A0A919GEL9_9ACTN|nr:hypothetical protein GCM10017771_08820 [Streptomyces capitiformicae]
MAAAKRCSGQGFGVVVYTAACTAPRRGFSTDYDSRPAAERAHPPPALRARRLYHFGKDRKWHGRVTVDVRDDGKPDRRHIERKTRAEVTKAVRAMERARDAKKLRKLGRSWTVQPA